MEKCGYTLLSFAVICWIGITLFGLIQAWPWGLLGLIGILGISFLFIKVVKDRLGNKEDDYYSKNINK